MALPITGGWTSAAGGAPPSLESPAESTARAPGAEPLHVSGLAIRAARVGDMRQVERLIRSFAARNLMLPKSFDQLARTFREFVVAAEPDGRIVGCGALRVYTEHLAEVCSLAVDSPSQRTGVGRLIVERLIENAREIEITTAFALTLKPEFFARLGFSVAPREDFPLKVWADCRNCPKLHACDEVAVARAVRQSLPAPAGFPAPAKRTSSAP